MPLPPLREPDRLVERAGGLVKGASVSAFLMSTLLAFNAAQTASLALLPVSRRKFRAFNRWAAFTWWGWCVDLSRKLNGVRIEVTGDALPRGENAIVVANHQQMPDIVFLMALAHGHRRVGDLKWFVKDSLKYVPGVGWGMLFIDCVFVKRDWATDARTIEQTFASIRRDRVPLWLVSFVEGTRLSPDKLEASRVYARNLGLRLPEHLQIPRTKGFVATVNGLRDHAQAVYDVTIGYEGGVPSLWQFIRGHVKVAHLHVRRYPLATMPTDEASLSRWLIERFAEKDRLMATFYRDGAFPRAERSPARS